LNTKPSHPLEDYAGNYEHPGYGVVSIKKEGDRLKCVFNSISFDVKHYHYDIFEINDELFNTTEKVAFFTDNKGNISSLSVKLEDRVDPVIFIKVPEEDEQEKKRS
jgi:hypothetical protein